MERRATYHDTSGLEWRVAVEKLMHGLDVRVHEFVIRAIGLHFAADNIYISQFRLEHLVVDTTDVPGSGHQVFFHHGLVRLNEKKTVL